MNKSEKFSSDIARIKKRNRIGGALDMAGAMRDLESLFVAGHPQCKNLALALFDWWKGEASRAPELEESAVQKLEDLNSFLDGEEISGALGGSDWSRVKEEVGYEAPNIPLDLLSEMMKTLVARGAI